MGHFTEQSEDNTERYIIYVYKLSEVTEEIKMSVYIILVIFFTLLVMCQSQQTIKTAMVKSDELEVQILRQDMVQLRKDLQQSKGKNISYHYKFLTNK